MNPIAEANIEVDKIDGKQGVLKLLLKVLIAFIVVLLFVIYVQNTQLADCHEKCGNAVKEERQKTATLEAAFREHLEKDNEYLRNLKESTK